MGPTVEISVRLGCFAGVLLVMATWEVWAPRRVLSVSKATRWRSNLGLVLLNNLAARWVMPLTAVAAAMLAASRGWGVLQLVEWPMWVEAILALLALDLAIYLQHVLFHAVPALWRLHLVHHADLDLDVTSGLRFHTLEILLSAWIKLAAVVFLGPTPTTVVAFEVLLNATAMFNHSNVRIPRQVERVLRWFIVTPDMHRVHHSVLRREMNSNFGFNVPWWDYWLGTYRDQPWDGHETMPLGLENLRDERQVERLPSILALPFTAPSAEKAEPDSSRGEKTGR